MPKSRFREQTEPTCGLDFAIVTPHFAMSNQKWHIWDLAGDEKYFTSLLPCFACAHCCCIVFDICKGLSKDEFIKWTTAVSTNCSASCQMLILVANKIDLLESSEGNLWAVANDSVTAAAQLATHHGYEFVQVSAKTGYNIHLLCNKIYQSIDSIAIDNEYSQSSHKFQLSNTCHIL